jgi:hypothetical protein
VGHGGSCPGYRSELILDTDDEVAVVFMANASGVNTRKYVTGLYDLVAARVKRAASKKPSEPKSAQEESEAPALDDYIGTYSNQPWGGETAVVLWEGGLAMLGLPTATPARDLRKLRHVEGDTFRRVRADDELAEAVIFLRDAQGRVTGFQQHRNVSPRIRM